MRAVYIGTVWPEPSSSAAGKRALDIIRTLKEEGWDITVASSAQPTPYSADLDSYDLESKQIAVNDRAFDGWIKQLSPDVVFFERFMTEEKFAWRIEEHCPNALRVVDTIDLHLLRDAREAAVKSGTPPLHYNDTALREIAAVFRSDLSLFISEPELHLLKNEFSVQDHLLAYWPFLAEEIHPDKVTPFSEREHFTMIGNFMHAPNLDSARHCKKHIWPLIRKQLPSAELHLYGSYGDKYHNELHKPADGVHMKGRADNALSTLSKYRVNLAPLRFGAGLKGKVLDGLQSGTPTVTSPIAAEGINGDIDWGCPIIDDPSLIAASAFKLHESENLWSTVQSQGFKILKERFDASTWKPVLIDKLRQALNKLDEGRQSNFIGQMLRHHHHRSTEFMSRWIEAKNQK